jgi:hypothetical protein
MLSAPGWSATGEASVEIAADSAAGADTHGSTRSAPPSATARSAPPPLGLTAMTATAAVGTGRHDDAHLGPVHVVVVLQMDRSSLNESIRSGIESTLTTLAHKLEGIDVQCAFGADFTPIDAGAAELNQVWTSLIENAVDTMAGQERFGS